MATSKSVRIAPWADPTNQRTSDTAPVARREGAGVLSDDRATSPTIASVSPATVPVVSIIGLGYVGVVSAGCLSARGFTVIGADLDAAKVETVAQGRSPIVERGLESLLAEGVKLGRISASVDVVASVAASDVTLLSVGTPTSADGGCDLTYVRAASHSIGAAIKSKPGYHCVILRCSVPPGTTLDVAVPEIEAASGKKLGVGFGICFSPEFLREGTAVADFADPPKVVIAASDKRTETMARRVLSLPGQRVLITSTTCGTQRRLSSPMKSAVSASHLMWTATK
jgi:GDP-mannose 6-dehydrogenase